ncbi:adenylate kinase [Chloropicon primus]|uniref:Adenylate kinase isoenzyme 6 homolog n=1 Tax=Chloropicon primus TaxID=1764295 RepID=A0A5B8MK99_9CHLO|nr:adenylate kinase [Chloropicon primus]UPQ99337.1 adenylate kinase [Chloropicon primus]|mmetsp:Transcript_6781/g.19849  ORF Transcript_6781/g.19849 Transcript_6781/m.19849 type:complete len:184 (-) Transcript_6781:1180-1731(-)|eukprot:QDZ20125.1 adenylate kinase [Chloropicon primus]
MTDKGNVLITGTPGTGKTSLASILAEQTGYSHIEIGRFVKDHNLHDGWDADLECYILNEDKVCDFLEERMSKGGNIVDHHGCDFFPERWFDHVVVLQTENGILYNRLEQRGYKGRKLQENIECEIMHVIVEEARESYKEEILKVLKSDTVEDQDANVDVVLSLLGSSKAGNVNRSSPEKRQRF